jgi:conjugal transfer/entry exclusion protein
MAGTGSVTPDWIDYYAEFVASIENDQDNYDDPLARLWHAGERWRRLAVSEHERAERLAEELREMTRHANNHLDDLSAVTAENARTRAERDKARQVARQLLRLARAQKAMLDAMWPRCVDMCLPVVEELAANDALSPALRRLVEE